MVSLSKCSKDKLFFVVGGGAGDIIAILFSRWFRNTYSKHKSTKELGSLAEKGEGNIKFKLKS